MPGPGSQSRAPSPKGLRLSGTSERCMGGCCPTSCIRALSVIQSPAPAPGSSQPSCDPSEGSHSSNQAASSSLQPSDPGGMALAGTYLSSQAPGRYGGIISTYEYYSYQQPKRAGIRNRAEPNFAPHRRTQPLDTGACVESPPWVGSSPERLGVLMVFIPTKKAHHVLLFGRRCRTTEASSTAILPPRLVVWHVLVTPCSGQIKGQ